MDDLFWKRFPLVAQHSQAHQWLEMQIKYGLAPNTIDAYGRALEDYLAFCARHSIAPLSATREHIAAYVHYLASRPRRARHGTPITSSSLANATMRQRLTGVRLFYDFLVQDGLSSDNPVGRGRYKPGKCFGGTCDRGLIPHLHRLPWIPTDEQWRQLLATAQCESLRNRVMLALAYDAGLRREELCSLAINDIDFSHRLLNIRAETTKNRQARVVPYSAATGELLAAWLRRRRELSRLPGPLFLSESRRNRSAPVSIWTWTKVVEGIAKRAGLPRFTTHTLRHLCLTDLARADWDIHEIALFAGHRSIQTTLQYIHLSGRDLAEKLGRSMASVHELRIRYMQEAFQ
jgi:integrase/recombinase XerD